ncbi:hypothetical protein [Rickettsiella endosymbiont of Dermanyssus gallinae]|uniref:hypothetical protein n=1 Tax=Rickettsiella endosymbiont of Dermanyssus gallinae TaxID=2856608 RepID=UPI001C5289ED|nr:hypothetical protein [Rickettsiella endosymbiont of Dermanyssus gallinae]
MPRSHNPQDNEAVSQTVSLPTSYLHYLSHKRINLNSDLENNITLTNTLRLFPGIKIEAQNQVSRYAPEEFRPWCPRNSFA